MAETMGQRIRSAREAKGWTQDDLAAAMKTSRSLVSDWERDATDPRGSTRIKLSDALDVSPEWIRTGVGPRTIPGFLEAVRELPVLHEPAGDEPDPRMTLPKALAVSEFASRILEVPEDKLLEWMAKVRAIKA